MNEDSIVPPFLTFALCLASDKSKLQTELTRWHHEEVTDATLPPSHDDSKEEGEREPRPLRFSNRWEERKGNLFGLSLRD